MAAALRIPFATTSGAFVTIVFFAVLWHLVGVPIDVPPPGIATKIEFKRLRADTPIEIKRQEKAERPPPTAVPDLPRTARPTADAPPTAVARPPLERVRLPRPGAGALRPDGDVVPIVRQSPEYPPRESARGVEGWVRVRFAVTAIGTVRDAEVVASDPPRVFDDAALKAIARWRYNPRVDNGIAVERVGLETIIRFELD